MKKKNKTTKIGLTSNLPQKMAPRPPIVVVLGHIDHGKTTLLSKIKEMDLTRKEHGGITQHIGAYQVNFQTPNSKFQTITFIDTPGHAAFNQMRSRGAKVADLAILVVAANEGVKPQTLESLRFIKEAGINYLVALNKIDLPGVNLESAKKNLADNGLPIEGFGGDVVVVPISAKEGKGIDELLEMILLLAEIGDFKGSPQAPLEATVIESKIDSRKGPLATVLVRNGSLRVGEEIRVENAVGKIRAMFDEKGQPVDQILPGQAAEVLGFKTVPPVGGQVKVERLEKEAREFSSSAKETSKNEAKISEEEEEKKLKIVLKADTEGTLEAIKNSLPVDCQIIRAEVGDVSESDVLLADTSLAEIVAFNVKIPNQVKKLAEVEKVKISSYQVIYELLEEIDRKILKMMEPTIDKEILGKAEIIAEFKMKERIAGCRVIEGEIKKTDQLCLLRGGKIIGNVRLKSMKKGKEDAQQAREGEEFGAVLSSGVDFNLGDVLVSFRQPQSGQ